MNTKISCSTKTIDIYPDNQGRNGVQLLKGKNAHTVYGVVKKNLRRY